MTRTIKLALAAFALAVAPVAMTAAPAAAQGVSVTVNPDIAFGYSDGYWDTNHAWHPWKNQAEAEAWRRDHAEHYYDRRHDAEANAGWRADDQWWAHH